MFLRQHRAARWVERAVVAGAVAAVVGSAALAVGHQAVHGTEQQAACVLCHQLHSFAVTPDPAPPLLREVRTRRIPWKRKREKIQGRCLFVRSSRAPPPERKFAASSDHLDETTRNNFGSLE